MDPTPAWSMGCSMACMNYQTWDLGMRLNFARFRLNGGCGYVLKPQWMRDAQWAPPQADEEVADAAAPAREARRSIGAGAPVVAAKSMSPSSSSSSSSS